MKHPRIDLDHAATSWPKPDVVLAAITEWFTQCGVSPNRGDSEIHRVVADRILAARSNIALRCGQGFVAQHVAFTSGATESLHLFLHGFLRPGDRVMTTVADHSSMLRPLHAMQSERGIELEILPVDPITGIDLDAASAKLGARPYRLLAMTHASNVTGLVLDAKTLMATAKQHGVTTLLDASQSFGALPVDIGADAVVASAHKSLLGPPGCGFLAVLPAIEDLSSPKLGGTGSARATLEHPARWPDAFEAGTPNSPAIFGLHAALRACDPNTREVRLARASVACDLLLDALLERTGTVRFVASPRTENHRDAPTSPADCLPILAFTVADQHPAETAALLGLHGVIARAGHHCAPLAHAGFSDSADGVGFSDGSVRLSPGPDLTADAIAVACDALRSL